MDAIVVPIRKDDGVVRLIPVDSIDPNPLQPRKAFEPGALDSLVDSIRRNGLLQPILVQEMKPGRYRIIAGERRWRASREAGLKMIPAALRKADETEELALALIENVQRENLNPVEEARAYLRLSKDFTLSHDQIAERVGKSRATVSNAIRLLTLPNEIIDALETGAISAGQARPLVAVSATVALEIYQKILLRELSARQVERLASATNGENAAERKGVKTRDPRGSGSIARIDAEERLMKKLGRSVKISGSDQKGYLKLDYYSKDDLINLVELLLEH